MVAHLPKLSVDCMAVLLSDRLLASFRVSRPCQPYKATHSCYPCKAQPHHYSYPALEPMVEEDDEHALWQPMLRW